MQYAGFISEYQAPALPDVKALEEIFEDFHRRADKDDAKEPTLRPRQAPAEDDRRFAADTRNEHLTDEQTRIALLLRDEVGAVVHSQRGHRRSAIRTEQDPPSLVRDGHHDWKIDALNRLSKQALARMNVPDVHQRQAVARPGKCKVDA